MLKVPRDYLPKLLRSLREQRKQLGRKAPAYPLELEYPVTLNNGKVVKCIRSGDLFLRNYVSFEDDDFFFEEYTTEDYKKNRKAVGAIYLEAIGCSCALKICFHKLPEMDKILEIVNLYVAIMNEELFEEKKKKWKESMEEQIQEPKPASTGGIAESSISDSHSKFGVCTRFNWPKISRKQEKKMRCIPWTDHDFFKVDEVICDSYQVIMVKTLFLSYFDIRFRNGRWISFSSIGQKRLEPIRFWYDNHSYPPLEIMIIYANKELKLRKEKENLEALSCSDYTPLDAIFTDEEAAATE